MTYQNISSQQIIHAVLIAVGCDNSTVSIKIMFIILKSLELGHNSKPQTRTFTTNSELLVELFQRTVLKIV